MLSVRVQQVSPAMKRPFLVVLFGRGGDGSDPTGRRACPTGPHPGISCTARANAARCWFPALST